MRTLFRYACVLGVSLGIMTPCLAQDYPTRPIKVVVPVPPGSATDTIARFIAERWAVALGQPLVVENRGGADGKIGAQYAARSEADGYTIFIGNSTTHTSNVNLFKSLPYDPQKDFSPIGGVMSIPLLLTVAPENPADDVQSLIAQARERELSYGNFSTTPRIAAELLKMKTGAKFKNVPYRGSSQALADLMGRQIDFVFSDLTSTQGLLDSGKVKVLAITSKTRASALPNVPALSELFPDFEIKGWVAVFAPAGTPPAIVSKLSTALEVLIQSPEVTAYLASVGAQPFPSKPQELSQFIEQDRIRWAEIVKIAGIEVQ